MKTCLIVGGTGYIGSGLVQSLSGRTTFSYSRHSSPPVDVRFSESIPPIGADEVIFSAGLIKNVSVRDSDAVTIFGLKNVLNALTKPTRFIYLSSLAAEPPKDGKELSLYGRRKAEAEKLLWAYAGRHHITVLRPCAVYGGEGGSFGVLVRFMKRYRAYPILPSQTIALVSLKDLCAAVQICLDRPETIGKTYPVVENHYTWEETSRYFASLEGISLEGGKPLPKLPFLEGLFHEWGAQSTELRTLGWHPSPLP